MQERLAKQLEFVLEIDRLKAILRRTRIADGSRRENSAEHSWHLAMMAMTLAEHAPVGTDVARAIEMLLVHDLVEIDAGDTFAYDSDANLDREEREVRAAERVFGLLPAEQGARFRALWDEFEGGASPEARYAVALDRLQPFLLNARAEGGTWRTHAVRLAQVRRRMEPIRHAMPEVWPVVERSLAEAVERGWLAS